MSDLTAEVKTRSPLIQKELQISFPSSRNGMLLPTEQEGGRVLSCCRPREGNLIHQFGEAQVDVNTFCLCKEPLFHLVVVLRETMSILFDACPAVC